MIKDVHLLLIEDSYEDAYLMRHQLAPQTPDDIHFHVEHADDLTTGLERLAQGTFDAVVADLMLPDSRGIETCLKVIAAGRNIPLIVLTGLGDEALAQEAISFGSQDFLVKGDFDAKLLRRSILYAIRRKKMLLQLEGVIEKSADGMVVVGADGIVQYVNPAAKAIFEREAEDMLGKPFEFSIVSPEAQLLSLHGPDSQEKVVEMRATEIEWQEGPARLASLRDITDLRRMEQLKAEIKDRQRLDELKDEFINTVSHELRTPLTIVKGAIDNLHNGFAGKLKKRQEHVIELAHHNINRLAKMIKNLLDLSRLESGKAAIYRTPLRIEGVVGEVLNGIQAIPGNDQISFKVDLPSDLPLANADADMIAQVMTNLIDNATRYAKSEVTIRGKRVPDGIQITIADDGPGIPAEKIDCLFDKFVQVNRIVGAGYHGTGLGLAICKEILMLHQSKIWAESEANAGAQFHFVLPEHSDAKLFEKTAHH